MRLVSLFAFAILCLPVHGAPKRLQLGFPGVEDRIEILFPENYDPDARREWPAVFYYHGTNGKPSTDLIRHHTKDRDWFVIGMAYVQKGKFTYTRETLEAEWRILHSTRNHLATKYNVGRNRVYAAGFSKGGWMSGFMLQRDPQLAGAIILGAGHIHETDPKPRRFSNRKPLFIGVGRKDGNYPFSLRALVFYRPLGARTTMETWHDLGHQFPTGGSPALTQWLAIEADPKGDHRTPATKWADDRLEEVKAMPKPVEQWVALRDLKETPYARVLEDTWQAGLDKRIKTLEAKAPVDREVEALTAHRTLLRKEMGQHTQELYESLLDDYFKLHQTYLDTRQGQIALEDHRRVKRLLQHFEEQDKIARTEEKKKEEDFIPEQPAKDPFEPKFPRSDRGIPRNPLIK